MRLNVIEKMIEESQDAKITIENALDITVMLPPKKVLFVVWGAVGEAVRIVGAEVSKEQRSELTRKYIKDYNA